MRVKCIGNSNKLPNITVNKIYTVYEGEFITINKEKHYVMFKIQDNYGSIIPYDAGCFEITSDKNTNYVEKKIAEDKYKFTHKFISYDGFWSMLYDEAGTSLDDFWKAKRDIYELEMSKEEMGETIKGDSEMNYRIEKKEAFRIVGVSEPLEAEIEKNFEIVPQMWGAAAMNGTIPRLAAMMEGIPKGLLGVSSCNESDNWRYYIAVASSKPIENDLEEYIVPSSLWAIFSGEGSAQSIQELEKRIVTEWLPTSRYEYG